MSISIENSPMMSPVSSGTSDSIDQYFTYMPRLFADISFEDIFEEWLPHIHNDLITLADGRQYVERRGTGWISERNTVFRYSNKSMIPARQVMPPKTSHIQQQINMITGNHFDSVLFNYYPDGKSGMHYHSDPVGEDWLNVFAVISIGDTREFILRRISNKDEKYHYQFQHGDVIFMYGDCQQEFEHCLKTCKTVEESKSRISLVFKTTRSSPNMFYRTLPFISDIPI
jgi:alkylated DNA repair dioxygenase AlkB